MRPRATHPLTHSLPPTPHAAVPPPNTYMHTQPQATRSSHLAEFKHVHGLLRSTWTYDRHPSVRRKDGCLQFPHTHAHVFCALSRTRVLISQHLCQRVCAVSLSLLLLAILNLAVWRAPATCDLSAATARHDTH